MSSLLVQGCSKSKLSDPGPHPAFELYSGYFYKIIKKAKREGVLRPDLDLCILSAEYGIVDPDEEISVYDRRMDPERARELQSDVRRALNRRIRAGDYDSLVFNLGQEYERAVATLTPDTHLDVTFIEGSLGVRGKKLKQLVRTDLQAALH